jgi:hypothetical protein
VLAAAALAATLVIDRQHVAARIDPRRAVGATVDVRSRGGVAEAYTHANIVNMLSAGFQPMSYRLATELGGEAWHWNPRGTWSDAAHARGYWTSAAESETPIDVSYGYRLPRRGDTISQSQNVDYSRIDDGDAATFWKSNPYLSPRPQWLFIDLGAPRRVQTMRITWAAPFATEYAVQHWVGEDPINNPADGQWVTFSNGAVHDGRGGVATLRLAAKPVRARWVRVLMTASSNTPAAAADWRDRAGFAVAELSIDAFVKHGKSAASQSVVWISSTDPWHRASDLDRDMEQPGLDLFFRSGLTRGLDTIVPVATLYGTPDDAANEIRFLRARNYASSRVEVGEEPDGQNVAPEDYGALYAKFVVAMRGVDRRLRFGGPSLQSTVDRIAFWPDEEGRTSWMARFLASVPREEVNFFTFEWYPFDRICDEPHAQLLSGPAILGRVLGNWEREGVPRDIPWIASEYGWSSYAGEPEVTLTGALFNADFLADFLTRGGAAAYFYGLEPEETMAENACHSAGNLALFIGEHKLATYWVARMLTHDWLAASGEHELHRVSGTTRSLTAFAAKRPDGTWSLLVINKGAATRVHVDGMRTAVQFSPREYAWDRAKQHPSRSLPPRRFAVAGEEVTLPAMSVTVLQE